MHDPCYVDINELIVAAQVELDYFLNINGHNVHLMVPRDEDNIQNIS